jgi:hypothetical protein
MGVRYVDQSRVVGYEIDIIGGEVYDYCTYSEHMGGD